MTEHDREQWLMRRSLMTNREVNGMLTRAENAERALVAREREVEEMRADRRQGGIDYCQLQDRADALYVEAQRMKANRDRIAADNARLQEQLTLTEVQRDAARAIVAKNLPELGRCTEVGGFAAIMGVEFDEYQTVKMKLRDAEADNARLAGELAVARRDAIADCMDALRELNIEAERAEPPLSFLACLRALDCLVADGSILGCGPATPQPAEGCICTRTCDCQSPPIHVSNHCPEHNYNPRPHPDCLAGTHWTPQPADAGEERKGDG